VLCNAASVEQSGLVSMLGAFIDTITGRELPIRQQLWMVARLLLEEGDEGVDQTIEILAEPVELDDAVVVPTAPLARISGTIRAERTPDVDPLILSGGPIVLPLALEFPKTGFTT
jgi:hypothetical protein